MSGIVIVNPIKAKLNENLDLFFNMDPYCIVHLGDQKIKSKVCRYGGKRPSWTDSIIVQRKYEPLLFVELKDKDFFSDDLIGVCQIELDKLPEKKHFSQWYPVFHKQKPAGEILIETVYTPDEDSKSVQNPSNNAKEADKKVEEQIQDPLKKSAYLAQHITPIQTKNQQPGHNASDEPKKPLYPVLDNPNLAPQRSDSHQQSALQGSGVWQPSPQQPGYQPNYQQTSYQQPYYQQPGRQQPVYPQGGSPQGGYMQPNYNQGGVWQPNMQGGVWQPGPRQDNFGQPSLGGNAYNQYNQGAQHQMP